MKIGIVGYGSIGKRHADNAATLGHEVIVYDPMVRRDVKFERMVYEQCDAVVIATPSPLHPAGLRAAAERGKHILIEKPIATSDSYIVWTLLELAERNKCVVMMGNNLRFHPCVKQAKDWIDVDAIGRPLWAQFTCAAKSLKAPYLSDGVILNSGAHEVDIALHLFGPMRRVLYADAMNFRAGTADSNINVFNVPMETVADFGIEHTNGVRSTFHLDFVTPNEIREAWIVGDKERIGIEFRNRNVSLGSRTTTAGGSYDDDYMAEMEAFVDRVNGKDTLGATGADGLATLRALLAVHAKMAEP